MKALTVLFSVCVTISTVIAIPPAEAQVTKPYCRTGGVLDPRKSPCVAQICAQFPTCCTDQWDQNCVDQVTSICRVICGPPPCPSSVELTLLAQTRGPCSSNADCVVGACNAQLGRCQTATELDTGWTGIAHDADITDGVMLVGNVDCPSYGPQCGQCSVTGINPQPGNCRCANDNRKICNQPFVADSTNCGGAVCNCYLGSPLPLSAGNTPACIVNKFAQNVSGTTNLDTGSSALAVRLRSVVYLGETLVEPCPYCTGDPTPDDGVRGGTCVLGPNAGNSCDANGVNVTFPAPGGDGASLDCFPSGGKNVSGSGLMINLDQTTGASTLTAAIPCGFGNAARCHCGLCSNDLTIPCSSNAACGAGTCQKRANFDPLPNQCDTSCTQVPGTQEGQCDGPTDTGCDAIVKANGEAFIACTTNADCDPANIGIPAGNCTASKRRECFLPSIVATGKADPTFPVGVATFCVPPTANLGINSTAGLPGPGRVSTQGATRGLCATGDYVPGSGCPG